MKVLCAALLLAILAGCTQARYRSGECDSLFYGQYQAMGEPKALAFAVPAADPQTATDYDTRCWTRAAAGPLPSGMSTEEAMDIVIAGVLKDCNDYNKENNSLQAAHKLDCRIAARNLVWEPWVNELRAADARAQGYSSASPPSPGTATSTMTSAYAVTSTDQNALAQRALPALSSPPVTLVNTPASSAPDTFGDKSREVTQFGFHDAFSWCPSPGNWCNNDQIIGIRHPQTGQLVGRLAVYIRPLEAAGNSLKYTVQITNESYCTVIIEGFEITQDEQVLGAWAIIDPDLQPAATRTVSELVSFHSGASSNALVSISGLAKECQL
jgi:hypothetical protein